MVLINYTRRKADKKEGGCYTPASEGQRPSEATHETLAQDVGFLKTRTAFGALLRGDGELQAAISRERYLSEFH